MSQSPADRGPDSLSGPRRFQVLRLDVEIAAEPETTLRMGLDYLTHSAVQPFGATSSARYDARLLTHGSWTIARDGRLRRRAPGAASAVDALYAIVNADALALWPRAPMVRGAVGTLRGRRFLMIGEPRAGVTSFAIRLMFGGASMEGDAFALLDDNGLIALPRRFALRTGARELLPEVAELLDGLPWLPDGADGRIWGLDPAEAGFRWELGQGPIHVCVVVEPNHGGRSRIFREAHHEMARLLMERCSPPPDRGSTWIARAAALVNGASCWRMQLGDLDEAVAALGTVL